MIETTVVPSGRYSLALSAFRPGDVTARYDEGVLRLAAPATGAPEIARVVQLRDGRVSITAPSAAAIDHARLRLGLEDDHTEFLRRFASDPLLGRTVRELGGMRPVRLGSIAHALLRGLCGQLIEASRAYQLERTIVRRATPVADDLHAPPSCLDLARFSPADLRAAGLHARRGAALVRICRSLDLERLRDLTPASVDARLLREPCVGPWTLGVVCLDGFGRTDRGLVGDLGLIKLVSALRGRWAEAWETEELLAPYGEWAGLAGHYLLRGWTKGLVPVPRVDVRRVAAAGRRA